MQLFFTSFCNFITEQTQHLIAYLNIFCKNSICLFGKGDNEMQQNNTEITLSWGFAPDERQTVADMYWLAFQEKLKIPLGPTHKAITFLTAVCDPNFALVARDTAGNILGVAGIKTAKGDFIGGSFAQLRDVYGTWGATWRAAMLSVLERPVKPDVLLMDGIFVGAAARGKGVGTKLLNTLIEHAESHNFAAIRLDVIDKNHGAQKLYERIGFVEVANSDIGPLRHLFGFQKSVTLNYSLK